MPDLDGYLTEHEILIGGEVWEIRDVDDGDWLCEHSYEEGMECREKAVVELCYFDEETHATRALCERHFEELTKKK